MGAAYRAYTLVFGGSGADPDHDAAMRIGSEVPGGGPILWDGVKAMPALGHRHLGSLLRPDRGCRGGAPNAL